MQEIGLGRAQLAALRRRERRDGRGLSYQERLDLLVPIDPLHRELIREYECQRPSWSARTRYWVALRARSRVVRAWRDAPPFSDDGDETTE